VGKRQAHNEQNGGPRAQLTPVETDASA
jgi:hypothetical protein